MIDLYFELSFESNFAPQGASQISVFLWLIVLLKKIIKKDWRASDSLSMLKLFIFLLNF